MWLLLSCRSWAFSGRAFSVLATLPTLLLLFVVTVVAGGAAVAMAAELLFTTIDELLLLPFVLLLCKTAFMGDDTPPLLVDGCTVHWFCALLFVFGELDDCGDETADDDWSFWFPMPPPPVVNVLGAKRWFGCCCCKDDADVDAGVFMLDDEGVAVKDEVDDVGGGDDSGAPLYIAAAAPTLAPPSDDGDATIPGDEVPAFSAAAVMDTLVALLTRLTKSSGMTASMRVIGSTWRSGPSWKCDVSK